MTLEDYEKSGHALYGTLAATVARILEAAISANGTLRLQQLQHRSKAAASLRKKLQKNGVQCANDVSATVKDLAGCRAIFYTNTDVEGFEQSGILPDNFEIDWERTKRHHPSSRDDQSLFISVNYVVRLKDDRASLPEYAEVAGLWCEVQIQTTLNHAWSEMGHDIIYKPPRLEGFGGAAMKAIEGRMRAIMRAHLIPAGYEFQKVAHDFDRLSRGLELFECDVPEALRDAPDNNRLYDLLERFVDYVLPHYDDLTAIYPSLTPALIEAVITARSRKAIPVETPFGILPGHTALQIEKKVAAALTVLRYLDIERTFDDAAALYESAPDEDTRKIWLDVINAVAENNLAVWKQYGAVAQHKLVKHVAKLKHEGRAAPDRAALTALRNALNTTVSGTSSTYNTITIHQGAVASGDLLRQSRSTAIATMFELFSETDSVAVQNELVSVLNEAARLPFNANYSDNLLSTILDDVINIVNFYASVVERVPFELRQRMEYTVADWHYRFRSLPNSVPDTIRAQAEAICHASLTLRDKVNQDAEFVIHKTLVGIHSVFPHAWEGSPFDFQRNEEFRAKKIPEYVAMVEPGSAAQWRVRVERCAATESNDLATSAPFERFLQELGGAKPDIALGFLADINGPLVRFVPALLAGLAQSLKPNEVDGLLRKWIKERRFTREVLHYLSFAPHADIGILRAAAEVALTENDQAALLSVVSAAINHSSQPEGSRLIHEAMLPAVERLTEAGLFHWVDELARAHHQGKLAPILDSDTLTPLLHQLSRVPRIEYHQEELLSALTSGHPERIFQFFDARLEREVAKEKAAEPVEFEAIPFELFRLHCSAGLEAAAADLVDRAYSWYRTDKQLFPYRFGRLIMILFPSFCEELREALHAVLQSDREDKIDFVLCILQPYSGQSFLLPTIRNVVTALPLGHSQLRNVESILLSTGVVSGEFGFVEAYRQKRHEMTPWLSDPDPAVQAFAARYQRTLDRMIAAEQRRGEENLELRKRNFGDTGLFPSHR
jgi:ppGpp synthetase/RelA/SpoT-type nucleotidyltranferase